MYYKDLSQYVYSGVNGNCLNIGWLDDGCAHDGQPLSSDVVDKLKAVSRLSGMMSGGLYWCKMCINNGKGKTSREHSTASIFVVPSITRPDTYYISPCLCDHYCSVHGYVPPKEFIDSLMALDLAKFDPRTLYIRLFGSDTLWNYDTFMADEYPIRKPEIKKSFWDRIFG